MAKESVCKESPKLFWLELFEFSVFHTSVARNFERKLRLYTFFWRITALSLTQLVFPSCIVDAGHIIMFPCMSTEYNDGYFELSWRAIKIIQLSTKMPKRINCMSFRLKAENKPCFLAAQEQSVWSWKALTSTCRETLLFSLSCFNMQKFSIS